MYEIICTICNKSICERETHTHTQSQSIKLAVDVVSSSSSPHFTSFLRLDAHACFALGIRNKATKQKLGIHTHSLVSHIREYTQSISRIYTNNDIRERLFAYKAVLMDLLFVCVYSELIAAPPYTVQVHRKTLAKLCAYVL